MLNNSNMTYVAYTNMNDNHNDDINNNHNNECTTSIMCEKCCLFCCNICTCIYIIAKSCCDACSFNKKGQTFSGSFGSNNKPIKSQTLHNCPTVYPTSYDPYQYNNSDTSYQYLPEPDQVELINSQTNLMCVQSEIIN
jgi:hypothetical protein